MAKIADLYYKLHPWKVIEEGFDPNRSMVSESIFSLGNEYMGVRGYFEEGFSGEFFQGSYFNGIYEYSDEVNKSAYLGIIDHTHFMVNSVDWLYTRISLDGEALDLNSSAYNDYMRVLDLKEGTLKRSFRWTTKNGKILKISFLRFLNMEQATEGCQRIIFEPVNFSGSINVAMGLDFSILQNYRQRNYWKIHQKYADSSRAAILGETVSSGQRVFSGFELIGDKLSDCCVLEEEKLIGYHFTVMLQQGTESMVDKLVTNLVEKNEGIANEELWNKGLSGLAKQREKGLDQALALNIQSWEQIWNRFDIEIDGDEKNQQGIRFCIFQMQQTYHGQNPGNNIGAKGLTGEAYNGHAFWDTETYCLPFYLFNNLTAAKNLLEFRYGKLDKAMERARMLDGEGACFPLATLNGEEACDLWQHASLQFQPSTGVAYGIWHYAHLSGDLDFLYGHGAEMLLQISRFLRTRGSWDGSGEHFGFYAVMGPDEFHMMVNNNSYTNYMAKKTFEYTVKVIRAMKAEAPEKLTVLKGKLNFTEEELLELKCCGEKMLILTDPETGVYEQHEGYFSLPHINIHDIPIEDFPLYHHWSYDRIYRYDMIKQPDVLMFQFLYNSDFSYESKRANYEYYEPRCIHESSLSPSIHSVLASELQKHQEAFEFFGFATRMDLDNYNRNTREGLHTTSLAGAWVNIVYGFGGLRSDGELLSLSPSIPESWNSYSFRIVYRTGILSVKVEKEKVTLTVLNDRKIKVCVYDKIYELDGGGISIPLPGERRG